MCFIRVSPAPPSKECDILRISDENASVRSHRAPRVARVQPSACADELPVYWSHTVPYHTIYNERIGNPPRTIWGTSSPLDEIYVKPE